ncbi:MAG: hypothetical protein DKM50_00005 [Candidatus Margulisiibacteriota bacterium]|nr:MAG: hypothetical protein DKM50_00005 [Candidatus Margulisiibacteriota bacterium]HCY37858.1 hypothetical protein [Candidatus Margulisiibacteriota bacterium]
MDFASILITVFVLFSIFGSQPQSSKQKVINENKQNKPIIETIASQQSTSWNIIEDIVYTPRSKSKTIYAADDDFQVIMSYIVGYYKKVPYDEAELIAKSIVKYGIEYDIDPRIIAALIARESSFNRNAVSITDAKGLGQIKSFNFSTLEIIDPFNIEQNVKGCTKHFFTMLKKWEGKSNQLALAIASYAEGYGAISRGDGKWKPETGRYIKDIFYIYKFMKTP